MSLHLFEAFGIELEYMIVDRDDLSIRPFADRVLTTDEGTQMEVVHGDAAWSNELAMHVLELKVNDPAPALAGLEDLFAENVAAVNRALLPHGAMLMPTAMHPWMDPGTELHLWPYENDIIYKTFDRIFGCKGHGWANLQSTHINLPFTGDDEFCRLHAAIRLILPLLPALAASSPVMDSAATGLCDNRVQVYATNARAVPSVTGAVIPETVTSHAEYQATIFDRIYRDLAPLDPEGILRNEWVNARGAIARFSRGSIEIRLLDIQECPRADLAISAAVVSVLRALVDERMSALADQLTPATELLRLVLDRTTMSGDQAILGQNPDEARYLALLGLSEPGPITAAELWSALIERTLAKEPDSERWLPALGTITRQGCLARRILAGLSSGSGSGRSLGPGKPERGPIARERLAAVYRQLCQCLAEGRMYTPGTHAL